MRARGLRWLISDIGRSPPPRLIGRTAECALLDQLLVDVRAHHSRVLVLRGEAGVGKTALLEHLAAGVTGCRLLRTTAVESEMELPFAALHQLCMPMLDRLDRLPAPQRDALGVAFGLLPGPAADRFLVGLALLSLLAEAAEPQPLVCLVDDAQWLDQASAQVMGFAARRLLAESVAVVFAVREPSPLAELHGLPERTVDGLSHADARVLLGTVALGPLDERVRDRIVAETGGNPLAILELPRGLPPARLAGGFALPAARPLASHIEQRFVERIQALPTSTQRLLVVAAAEPLGDAALLRSAAAALDLVPADEIAAEEAGLIELGARVRFRHPLVRSAAYRSASASARREAHQALAAATDPEADPDRRAWHRAQGAHGFDDDVAVDLERSAARAQRRGGHAAAAAFLERAASLTTDPAQRSARALAAAQAKLQAGAPDDVEALVATAELGELNDVQAALVRRLRAQVVSARHRGNRAPPLLLGAARALEPLDAALAREAYLDALGAAIFAGRLNEQPTLRDIAEAAAALPPTTGEPRSIDLLLAAVTTRFTADYATAAPLLRRAVDHIRQPEAAEEDLRWLWLAWLVAGELWDDEAWDEIAVTAVRLARETGALTVLPVALHYLAGVRLHAGDLATAALLTRESDTIAAATGNAQPWYGTLLLTAWQGDETSGLQLIERGVVDAGRRGEGRAVSQGGYFVALLCNGLGRYEEALVAAQQACQHDDLGVLGFSLVELIEAAARADAPEAAAEALEQLAARTDSAGTEWALGMLARSRALLAADEAAEADYQEAIDRLGRTRVQVHLARARLLYGEWLRRQGRRLDAREQLRAAHEVLELIGAAAFAERAARELRALGEVVRPRSVDAAPVLTAQEAQIAELAGQGRTNHDIASELYISPKTVEYHLRKVFVKLGIGSRRELRTMLPPRGLTPSPG